MRSVEVRRDTETRGLGDNSVFVLVSIGAFLIVLSQFINVANPIYTAIWIFLALDLVGSGGKLEGFGRLLVHVTSALVIFCCVGYLLTGTEKYLTGFLVLYLKAVLSYVIGVGLYKAFCQEARWKRFFVVYAVAVAIYMLYVFANYFPGWSDWLSAQTYLFGSKNSFGQLVGAACLICFCYAVSSDISRKWLFAIVPFLALGLFSLLIFQCRTSMIGVVVGIALILACKGQYKWIGLICIALALIYCLNPNVQDVVAHFLQTDKYDDVDGLSSGRLGIWQLAIDRTEASPLIGLGSYYCDNFYICLYANWGAIGSALFLVLWIYRIYKNFSYAGLSRRERMCHGDSRLAMLVLGLTGFYLIESLFEGNPPLGPGACSFVFWLLCGYLDSRSGSGSPLLASQHIKASTPCSISRY